MNRFLLGGLVAVVVAALLGALDTSRSFGVGGCRRGTTTEVNDESYETMSGKTGILCFEPDADAAATDAEIAISNCLQQDPESCVEWWFDYDFDGVPDGNILDGVSLGQRCTPPLEMSGYLRIVTTTAPAAADDIAIWELCGTDH